MKTKAKITSIFLAAVFMLIAVCPVFVTADENYTVSYNQTVFEVKKGDDVIIVASPNLPSKTTDIKYQWYVTTTGKFSEAVRLEGATESLFKVNTKTSGVYYYFCEVTATHNGKEITTLNHSNMSAVRVTVKNSLTIVPVGKDNVSIYSPDETIFLKVEVENSKNPSVSWYTCDEKGNTSSLIAIGSTLVVNGISKDKLGIPQYYACIATDSDGIDLHVFSCTLKDESMREEEEEEEKSESSGDEETQPPEETEDKDEYKFPFSDVKESDWFYNDVKTAHKNSLINGKSETEYFPDDNMTYAEAVKLACAIHQSNRDGKVTIPNGSTFWYSTYMDYALTNGIIEQDLSDKADEPISRKEYVYIFYKALPEEKFAEINSIAADSIPDVEAGKYYHRIYTFYRAGILTGSDENGTFFPDSNIKRSEVAAILTRMTDADARKNITLK